ncbi:MAG: repeat-containing protein, partial [Nevskia sp.]|nr:repeat-containing protein [Nevskia sp.]
MSRVWSGWGGNVTRRGTVRRGTGFALGMLCALGVLGDATSVAVGNAGVTVTGATPVTMDFPLTRSGDNSYDAWISYVTQDGSAIDGIDYNAAKGAVLIAAGGSTAQIPVIVAGSASSSPDKTFQMKLLGGVVGGAVPAFAAAQSVDVGPLPSAIAYADFNGDGRPDLVTNGNNGLVEISLNNTPAGSATASFAAPQPVLHASFITGYATADINGDGKPDLVVDTVGGGPVYVLLNTTAPGAATVSFGAPLSLPTLNAPISVIATDLNGDGKPDLALPLVDNAAVLVWINTTPAGSGTASFAPPQTFAVEEGPESLRAIDVNGDGRLDLVSANQSQGTVSVLLNTTAPGATTPSFAAAQSFPAGVAPYWISSADLNGDGKPDLVVSENGVDKVVVLLNATAPGSATAAFTAHQDFTTGGSVAFGVEVADVNHDGRADLLVTNMDTSTVSVLQNVTTTGSNVAAFAPHVDFAVGNAPDAIVVADFNGDGAPDVATLDLNVSKVSLLFDLTAPSAIAPGFATPSHAAAGGSPKQVLTADFNGDGRPDLAIVNHDGNAVQVLTDGSLPENIVFSGQASFAVGDSPFAAAAADFNGDGKPDLVVGNYAAGTVSVLLNTTAPGAATPAFTAQKTFAAGSQPLSVATADFNGDGRPDIVVANFNSSFVSVLLDTTAPGASTPSFAAQTQININLASANAVAVADVNHDGKPDIVITDDIGKKVGVLLNTTATGAATPSFSAEQEFAAGAGPDAVAVRDLNGDGLPDLVVTCHDDNTVAVLLNTTTPGSSTAQFAAAASFATAASPTVLSIADIDGDGKPDLLVGGASGSAIQVFYNNTAPGSSSAAFGAPHSVDAADIPAGLAVADLTGVGEPELVSSSLNSAFFDVLLNTRFVVSAGGTGTGTIHYDIPVIGGLSLEPESLGFGLQPVGKPSAVHSATLTNTSGSPVGINGITTTVGFSQGNNCLGSLAAGASCKIDVTFLPPTAGPFGGTLSVSNGVSDTPLTVALLGTGVASAPGISADPTVIDFGAEHAGDSSEPAQVTLTNTGGTPVTVSGVTASGSNASAFVVQNGSCGEVLAAGASCTYRISFAPQSFGSYEAVETFTTDQAGISDTVTVSGEGSGAVGVLTPDTLDFGDQPMSTSSMPKNISLQNNGNATLVISLITVSGDYRQSNDCPTALAPGADCTIAVVFAPGDAGASDGVLTVSSASQQFTAQLRGTGTVPGITVTPPRLSFGSRALGSPSAAQSVQVSNSGGTTLQVGAPTIGDAAAADFNVASNGCTAPLEAGASCSMAVVFTPRVAGSRSATLSISSNAGSQPFKVSLAGTGVGPSAPVTSATVTGGGAIGLPFLGLFGLAALLRRVRRRGALSLTAMAGALLCLPAQAFDTDRIYFGTRQGEVQSNLDGGSVSRTLREHGYGIQAQGDGRGFGAMAYAGYSLLPDVGLEVGYTRARQMKLSIPDAAAGGSAALEEAAHRMRGVGDAYSFSLRYHGELLPRLSLDPRAGFYVWDSQAVVNAGATQFER